MGFDSAADLSHIGNTTPQTFSLTTSGIDRVLYLGVTRTDPLTPPGTPTYAGVEMSLLDLDEAAYGVWIYRLINPALGTNTISIPLPGAPDAWVFAAVAFNDTDQTTPNGTGVKFQGETNTPSVNVPSAAGKTVLGIIAVGNPGTDTIVAGAGQTQRTEEFASTDNAMETTTEDGAASVTTNWTLTNNRFCVVFGYSINSAEEAAQPAPLTFPERKLRPAIFSPGIAR